MTLIFIADFLMIVLFGLVARLWQDYAREQARLRRRLEIREKTEAIEALCNYTGMSFSEHFDSHKSSVYRRQYDNYKAARFKRVG